MICGPPRGERPGDIEDACDLLTPNEGKPIGSTMANIQKQKKDLLKS